MDCMYLVTRAKWPINCLLCTIMAKLALTDLATSYVVDISSELDRFSQYNLQRVLYSSLKLSALSLILCVAQQRGIAPRTSTRDLKIRISVI